MNRQKEVEAPGGFEPPHRSFADCLRPIVMEKYQDRRRAIDPTTFNRMTGLVL